MSLKVVIFLIALYLIVKITFFFCYSLILKKEAEHNLKQKKIQDDNQEDSVDEFIQEYWDDW